MTVYRFMSVYGLTWIINRFRKVPIPYNDQFIMSLSGLRKGSTKKLIGSVSPQNRGPKVGVYAIILLNLEGEE